MERKTSLVGEDSKQILSKKWFLVHLLSDGRGRRWGRLIFPFFRKAAIKTFTFLCMKGVKKFSKSTTTISRLSKLFR